MSTQQSMTWAKDEEESIEEAYQEWLYHQREKGRDGPYPYDG